LEIAFHHDETRLIYPEALLLIVTQPKTYIRDESESDVSAIIVVETGDEGVRVTENRSDVHWSAPFWMPEHEFRANTHGDSIETVGVIPDEKFEQVMSIAEGDL
jgi:hypothetical protein